ncbi:MAG: hypothetical protein SOR77_07600, partial [Peptoniphilus sp.]|uniref:hypothetical protein n=1 Tax=Peptoniphilus sp. TaxID=1971214 RepID=UPI002A74FE07
MRKLGKRALSLFLALIMLFGSVNFAFATETNKIEEQVKQILEEKKGNLEEALLAMIKLDGIKSIQVGKEVKENLGSKTNVLE